MGLWRESEILARQASRVALLTTTGLLLMARVSAPAPVDPELFGVQPAGFDPKRNQRFAYATLEARFAAELTAVRELLSADGVDPSDPGAPAEWGDAHLLRYVLGFGSAEAAAEAFKRSREWMREHDGDQRRAQYAAGAPLEFARLTLMRQLAPMQRIGEDHHGCPVIVYYLGQLKPRQLMAHFSFDDVRAFNMMATERTYCGLMARSTAARCLKRSVVVLDLGGVGLNMLAPRALANLRAIVSELTTVYIEMVDRVFFVRMPIAAWVQSMALSFAPARSHHKFQFLGNDFAEELAQYVPRERLPEALLTGVPPAGGWGLEDGDVDTALAAVPAPAGRAEPAAADDEDEDAAFADAAEAPAAVR